jgi:hypothetical protein
MNNIVFGQNEHSPNIDHTLDLTTYSCGDYSITLNRDREARDPRHLGDRHGKTLYVYLSSRKERCEA